MQELHEVLGDDLPVRVDDMEDAAAPLEPIERRVPKRSATRSRNGVRTLVQRSHLEGRRRRRASGPTVADGELEAAGRRRGRPRHPGAACSEPSSTVRPAVVAGIAACARSPAALGDHDARDAGRRSRDSAQHSGLVARDDDREAAQVGRRVRARARRRRRPSRRSASAARTPVRAPAPGPRFDLRRFASSRHRRRRARRRRSRAASVPPGRPRHRAQRHEHLLLAPGDHVEEHLHDLRAATAARARVPEGAAEPGRVGDEAVGESERCPLALVEPRRGRPRRPRPASVLVEPGLPGTRQAKGHSGLAVVVAGTVQAHELRRDRVERVQPHRGCVQAVERRRQGLRLDRARRRRRRRPAAARRGARASRRAGRSCRRRRASRQLEHAAPRPSAAATPARCPSSTAAT